MKKFFLENLGLKIAAVLVSVVLWIFVTSRGQSEISIDVPLEFKNVPASFEMVNHSVKAISLNVKGQERIIKNIRPSDIRVSIDLSKARKGESVYYIHREEIKLPHGVTVTNINPSSVKVVIEETITKTVKIVPVVVGEPEKGYYVKSVEVMPQHVVIEGIRSEIGTLKTIKTEQIDMTGMNETFTQDLKLDLTGKNIRAEVNTVSVRVVIGGRGKN
jgi:YbbR domain-containing protein